MSENQPTRFEKVNGALAPIDDATWDANRWSQTGHVTKGEFAGGTVYRRWETAENTARDAEEAAFEEEREAAAAVAYRGLRQRDYITDLSDGNPTFEEAVGDTLDELIKEVARISAATPGVPSVGFTALLTKIAAVKARHPKPEPVARPETP